MYQSYQSLLTEVDDSVGILTLNKAERHNAFDELLIDEVHAALEAVLNRTPEPAPSGRRLTPARASARDVSELGRAARKARPAGR